MTSLSKIIQARHSDRGPFDPQRAPSESDLREILEAARWAPTPHNMQNFEAIVVDDQATLAAIGRVHTGTTYAEFVQENIEHVSFSEEEFIAKGTGFLATMLPPSWVSPGAKTDEAADHEHGFLDAWMASYPVLLIIVYDTRHPALTARTAWAPASAEDYLGIMGLGCVLQNIWLTAEELGLGLQVMSIFSAEHVEDEVRRILNIPEHLNIGFACRIGYPAAPPGQPLRIRRAIERFTHHNSYGAQLT